MAKRKRSKKKASLTKPRLAGPRLAGTSLSAKAKQFAGGSKSGMVPIGDVRLTANIRQDLHKKLKHAAVDQETTVGELLEALIDKHL